MGGFEMNVISVGHDNFIPSTKISMILQVESRSIRKKISEAKLTDRFFDATGGKKSKSVIITTEGFLVVSSINPKTLAARLAESHSSLEEGEH